MGLTMKKLSEQKKLQEAINYIKTNVEYGVEEEIKLLKLLKKALNKKYKNRLYARVTSVSRSGMSKTVEFYLTYDGCIVNLNSFDFMSYLLDTKPTNDGFKMRGCGSDMAHMATLEMFIKLYNSNYNEHLDVYYTL